MKHRPRRAPPPSVRRTLRRGEVTPRVHRAAAPFLSLRSLGGRFAFVVPSGGQTPRPPAGGFAPGPPAALARCLSGCRGSRSSLGFFLMSEDRLSSSGSLLGRSLLMSCTRMTSPWRFGIFGLRRRFMCSLCRKRYRNVGELAAGDPGLLCPLSPPLVRLLSLRGSSRVGTGWCSTPAPMPGRPSSMFMPMFSAGSLWGSSGLLRRTRGNRPAFCRWRASSIGGVRSPSPRKQA